MEGEMLYHEFESHFAAPPDILVRAPGRINLIGEHTDYNGGLVLPAAIDRAIRLAAGRRSDGRFAFFARDLNEFFLSDGPETVFQQKYPWANYLLGVIDEARKDGHRIGGLNVAFGGDIPIGAGLSSSAALESGTIFAVNELFGLGLSKIDLVRLAQRGENYFVGMQCGIMDMFASVMGRENCVVRLDCRSLEYGYFPFHTAEYRLVLFDSGIKHALVDSEYNRRRAECEAGVATLQRYDPHIASLRDVSVSLLENRRSELPDVIFKRCRYVVEEIERVEEAGRVLQRGDFEALGRLMYQTHEGLARQYEVSIPALDFLVDAARRHGATGSRMMGGGFGGCTLNLLRADLPEDTPDRIAREYRQAFGLDLRVYAVRIAGGTERM